MKIHSILIGAAVLLTFVSILCFPKKMHHNVSIRKMQLAKASRVLQDEDSTARKDFMRAKLMFTKNILDGLTSDDFPMINRSIKEVKGITSGEEWVEIQDDQYKKLTEEFNRILTRLEKAGKAHNSEAVTLRFFQLTSNCIDCHELVRKSNFDF